MSNPSMQCSVCGQWKRYVKVNGPDAGMNTFYPVCIGHDGTEHEHEKPVCDECCKYKCPYRFKDVVLISKPVGTTGKDKLLWMAEINGDVIDYHSKDALIKNAGLAGNKWAVISYFRRSKSFNVMQSNY